MATASQDSLRRSKEHGPVRYRFEVMGKVSGKHDMVIEGDEAHLEPAGSEAPRVIFRCDTGTFVLMMYQRLTSESAAAAGRLTAEGDRELISDFHNRWFERA